jgi:hypothetical protein
MIKPLSSRKVNRSGWVSFTSGLWPLIDFSKFRLKVSYRHAVLRNSVSYLNPFKKVVLSSGKTLVAEKQTLSSGIWLEGEAVHAFGRLIDTQGEPHADHAHDLRFSEAWDIIIPFEAINPGLACYY